MMRAFSISLLLMFLWVSVAVAAEPGDAGFTFLKVGIDARADAMGGAHVALTDDVDALYYNPAGMAWAVPGQVLATYNNWVSDIQSGFVGGVARLGTSGRIGASIQYLNFGDFRAADASGTPLPGFSASDIAVAVGMARMIDPRTSFGVTGRFIAESIDGESATALSFDVGLIHRLGDQRTRIGIAVRNAGFQASSFNNGPKDKLPVTGVVGFSHHLRGAPLLLAVDLLKPSDDKFGFAAGVEFLALKPLLLRAGYNSLDGRIDTGSSSDNAAGLRFGAGFVLHKLTIDYGFGFLSELGSTHRFTIRTNIL